MNLGKFLGLFTNTFTAHTNDTVFINFKILNVDLLRYSLNMDGPNEKSKYFYIFSRLSERVLDIYQRNAVDGNKVVLWDKDGGDHQVWFHDPLTLTIRSKLNPALCLSINGRLFYLKCASLYLQATVCLAIRNLTAVPTGFQLFRYAFHFVECHCCFCSTESGLKQV
jgi:Ricin-type beta-trefoil lectin domain-like